MTQPAQPTATDPQPPAGEQPPAGAAPTPSAPPSPPAPPAGGETDPTPQEPGTDGFKSEESKNRVLADLAEERKQRQALQEKLREIEDAKLSDEQRRERDLEERAQRIAELEKTNAELSLAQTRRDVADAAGLPSWMAPRLQGTTEDELRADAEKVLAELGTPKPPTPRPDPGQGGRPAGTPDEDDVLYESIYGNRK
ncbi:MAG: hypothetical protein ACI39C_07415 [Dietzia sp.]